MSLIITDAGIAASIHAGDLGIEYKITHISIGTAGYVPDSTQTKLQNEVQKKAITRGDVVALGQLHFETVWDGDEEFEGKELGYWLEDGTLFAVDSRDGEVITFKHKNTVVTEACELNLSASTISNITVELLGTPHATEAIEGTAKIATSEQVTKGDDDTSIITPKKLKENAATNDDIDNISEDEKHIKLSQLWRALSNWFKAHKEEDNPHEQYFSEDNLNISDSITGESSNTYASEAAVKAVNDQFTSLFTNFKTTNGYQKLPSGLIVQWGIAITNASGIATATLPMAFPNAHLIAVGTHRGSGAANVINTGSTKTTVTFKVTAMPAGTVSADWWAYYIAIGY